MDPGVAALAGVLIGALLSAAIEFIHRALAARQERRTAARVLRAELLLLIAASGVAHEQEDPRLFTSERVLALWEQHASSLSTIAYDDWDALARAMAQVGLLTRVPNWTVDALRMVNESLDEAERALKPYEGRPTSAGREEAPLKVKDNAA